MANATMERFKKNLSMTKIGQSAVTWGTAGGIGFLYGYKAAKGEKMPAVGGVDAVVIGSTLARLGSMLVDPSYGDWIASAADGAGAMALGMKAVTWGTDYAKKQAAK